MEFGNGLQVDLLDNANEVDGLIVVKDGRDLGVVPGVVPGVVGVDFVDEGKAVVLLVAPAAASAYAKSFKSMCNPSCSVYHPI
jgi:hypothetical protein